MLEKLIRFGAKPYQIPQKIKNKLMSDFEEKVGILPEEYKKLLLYFGGDITFAYDIVFSPLVRSPWTAPDGTNMLDILYGLTSVNKTDSIFDIYEMYKNQIHKSWIPIGAAPGGNQICLNISAGKSGIIGLWDHESEETDDLGEDITLIEKSLDKFIELLKIDSSPPVDLDDIKVELNF